MSNFHGLFAFFDLPSEPNQEGPFPLPWVCKNAVRSPSCSESGSVSCLPSDLLVHNMCAIVRPIPSRPKRHTSSSASIIFDLRWRSARRQLLLLPERCRTRARTWKGATVIGDLSILPSVAHFRSIHPRPLPRIYFRSNSAILDLDLV